MYDLIYLDYFSKATEVLEKIWPEAKIEDASDFIHTEQFAIEVDVEEEEYFKTVLREGMALSSLSFQSLMLEDGQNASRLLKEAAAEREQLKKLFSCPNKEDRNDRSLLHPKLQA